MTARANETRSLVLLGDSILDNAPYTSPEPDTTEQLRGLLSADWSVSRLAVDGATIGLVGSQLERLDGFLGGEKAELAVLSIGGNDVTAHIGMLNRPVANAAETLGELLAIGDDFRARYEAVARAVAERAVRTLLCTIYEVPLEPPRLADLARAPLSILNDQIIRTGTRLGVDVLDLRSVCTEPEDYVLQIEPSAQGARKIAEAIAGVVRGEGTMRSGRVFAGAGAS